MSVSQIKAGAALNYVVIVLNALVGFVYTPYMLHMLGQSEYGLYSLVASVISYLTIMDFGFGNAIIRYTAKFRAEGKTQEQFSMFGMFLVIYAAIGLLAVVAGLVLFFNVDTMFGDTMTTYELGRAKIMMLILTLNLAFTFPFSVFGSIITAYEDFVFQKSVQIIRILLNTAVMVCLLKMGYKAIAMVVVQTVFNVLTLLINLFYCRYKIRIKFLFSKVDWSFLKEIVIYSFWIFLNIIMDKIYWSSGQFILGAVSGTVAVAVYAVAIHLEGMYMTFSTAISSVFLPKISGMVARNESDATISDLFIRTGRIQFIVLAFVFSGFIVFGQQFIDLWAGKDYADAYLISLLFLGALLVPLVQSLGITILQARNQMKFRSLLYVSIAAVSLVAQVLLSKKYGGIGCAVAISGALVIGQGLIMNIYYAVRQRIDIRRFWQEILKMSIIPVLMTTLGLFVTRRMAFSGVGTLALEILAYSLLYVPLFWTLSMSDYERMLIAAPLRKLFKK